MSSPGWEGPIKKRKLKLTNILSVLEVVQNDMESFAVLAKVLDNDTAASNDLSRVTLAVNLAKTSPSTEDFGVTDLDEVDLVLSAESLDELDVFCLADGLDENTEMGQAFVQSFGTFAKSTSQTVVN